MKASNAFPSKYLKASDLNGQSKLVKIKRVDMEQIDPKDESQKPVIFVSGSDKPMVANKTNWNKIISIYGDETDDWEGQEIVLFPAMVDFKGETVEAIRVRAPQPKDKKSAPAKPADDMNDDIPF